MLPIFTARDSCDPPHPKGKATEISNDVRFEEVVSCRASCAKPRVTETSMRSSASSICCLDVVDESFCVDVVVGTVPVVIVVVTSGEVVDVFTCVSVTVDDPGAVLLVVTVVAVVSMVFDEVGRLVPVEKDVAPVVD